MNETGGKRTGKGDDTVEAVLGRAAPRPRPSAAVAEAARAALRTEWQDLVRARRRRRVAGFGMVASAVVALALGVQSWLAPPAPPLVVASLERSVGTIYLLGESDELRRVDGLSRINAGQTIVTAEDSTAGLRRQGGGSLRLGAATELRFVDRNTVELGSGRIYYDSANDAAALVIETPLGDVAHVGTQFIAGVDADRLTVLVREGQVAITGRFHDTVASAGERVTLAGSREPQVQTGVAGYGSEWEWVEATAQGEGLAGARLIEFLQWVSRETGLRLVYENESVEVLVNEESVKGDVSKAPRDALRQSLLATDLAFEIKDGEIRIRQAGNR